MKPLLLKLFSPILKLVEVTEVDSQLNYRPSHRKILWVMGVLFLIISAVALFFGLQLNVMAALLPVILFGGIGLLCFIVAGLGSDQAVSKLWRNR